MIGVILSVCLSVSGITEKVMININEFGVISGLPIGRTHQFLLRLWLCV